MALHAIYVFRDNSGKRARSRLVLSPDLPQATASAYALAVASALQGVSDATLESVTLRWTSGELSTPAPGPDSDVYRSLILFYRNGDDTASITVPSGARLLTETDGAYRGARVTRASVGMQGLLTSVDSLLLGALDPAGRPYGSLFSVGCIIGGAQ